MLLRHSLLLKAVENRLYFVSSCAATCVLGLLQRPPSRVIHHVRSSSSSSLRLGGAGLFLACPSRSIRSGYSLLTCFQQDLSPRLCHCPTRHSIGTRVSPTRHQTLHQHQQIMGPSRQCTYGCGSRCLHALDRSLDRHSIDDALYLLSPSSKARSP